jgi:phospholipid/cholesterol/gamma-HCH transport system substrate-binding protein
VALVGAVVVVVLAIAVYLSYNSVHGLPWQSTYDVAVEVPNGDHLVSTDEVRVGGIRVGQVTHVTAMPAPAGGQPYTRVELALDPAIGRLPLDTQVKVRPSSALGATYVNLTLGKDRRTLLPSGTLPLANSQSTVDLVDLLDIFDRSTAQSIQRTFSGLGAGLGGRGPALNDLLGALNVLLPPLTRVSAALAAPQTQLPAFLRGYEAFVSALAPVSAPLAGLVADASTTFDALVQAQNALGATIDELPATESATTSAFTELQLPLDGLATLVTDLRPGGALLPSTLKQINLTLNAGLRPLAQVPPFATDLRQALKTLADVTRMPATDGAVRKLTDLVDAAGTTLQVLTPAQVYCNVIALFGIQFGKTFGAQPGPISYVNFDFVTPAANGSILQSASPSTNLGVNYYPNENAKECESGNEPAPGVFGPSQLGNPPGNQSRSVPTSAPPPGVTALAQRAGLLNAPPGTP